MSNKVVFYTHPCDIHFPKCNPMLCQDAPFFPVMQEVQFNLHLHLASTLSRVSFNQQRNCARVISFIKVFNFWTNDIFQMFVCIFNELLELISILPPPAPPSPPGQCQNLCLVYFLQNLFPFPKDTRIAWQGSVVTLSNWNILLQ